MSGKDEGGCAQTTDWIAGRGKGGGGAQKAAFA